MCDLASMLKKRSSGLMTATQFESAVQNKPKQQNPALFFLPKSEYYFKNEITCLLCDPKYGRLLLVSTNQGYLTLLNAFTGKTEQTRAFEGEFILPNRAKWYPRDDRLFALIHHGLNCGCGGLYLDIWDANEFKSVSQVNLRKAFERYGTIHSSNLKMDLSPALNSSCLVGISDSTSKMVKILDLIDGKDVYSFKVPTKCEIIDLQWCPVEDNVLSASAGEEIFVYDVRQCRHPRTVFDGKSTASSFCRRNSQKERSIHFKWRERDLIFCNLQDKSVRIWDFHESKLLKGAKIQGKNPHLAVSADGKQAAVSNGNILQVYDITKRKCVDEFRSHMSEIRAISYCPVSRDVYCAAHRAISIWSSDITRAYHVGNGAPPQQAVRINPSYWPSSSH